MKHILGSCVLAGLFLFCACDDTLDTKVTWQIGDSDTWRVPELAPVPDRVVKRCHPTHI